MHYLCRPLVMQSIYKGLRFHQSMNVEILISQKSHYFVDGAQVIDKPDALDVTLSAQKPEDQQKVPLTELHAIMAIIREQNLQQTPREAYFSTVATQISGSVDWDELIIQATKSLDEADLAINLLSKRLREWFEWHNPEFSRSIGSHEKFAELVLVGDFPPSAMGAEFDDTSLSAVKALATQIVSVSQYKEQTREYIQKQMEIHTPNFLAIGGVAIAAKILAASGRVSHLAKLPSSTIQLLGAEKALFRHLRSGASPPKYGLLFQHSLVQNAPNSERGKIARSLANAMSIAIRKDYYGDATLDEALVTQLLKKVRV